MPVSPPVPRLPPLNALRAFEAAARLGGFAAAAQELRVSPGAVAAHVKALEESFGAALFERHARGVRLTALGLRALPGLTDAFDRLGLAVQGIRRDARPWRLHVATLPSLAQLWLSPRLPALRAALPEADISVTALEAPPNLKRTPFDLCLFYAERCPPGGRILSEDAIFPVCAPAVAARLRSVEDLHHAVCLSDTTWPDDWATWAATAMPAARFEPTGPVFSLYALAVEEAVNGAGVLMGHRALVERHLASGALVAPFAGAVPLARRLALWSLAPGGEALRRVSEILAGS